MFFCVHTCPSIFNKAAMAILSMYLFSLHSSLLLEKSQALPMAYEICSPLSSLALSWISFYSYLFSHLGSQYFDKWHQVALVTAPFLLPGKGYSFHMCLGSHFISFHFISQWLPLLNQYIQVETLTFSCIKRKRIIEIKCIHKGESLIWQNRWTCKNRHESLLSLFFPFFHLITFSSSPLPHRGKTAWAC